MITLYDSNGLVHWTSREINMRERMQSQFAFDIYEFLKNSNPAWTMDRTEGPIMIPRSFINKNYINDDLWVFQKHVDSEIELVARPETTPSTYVWMVNQIHGHNKIKLPWCVWQSGKSFRNEQNQVTKNMRLKEFWQQEFQCAYSADTFNDYHSLCLEPIRKMIASNIGLPTRIIESDRLPSYSQITMDIEVDTGDRWMEVCSVSRRTDFPIKYQYETKKRELKEIDILILEIAIGLDRCVYAKTLSDNKL